ncbi:hypothetical protein ACQE3E_06560 [Methylomonas sp. MED-D]|uniref:hypothetical protein n=1 Tax=Methylomonas sp. MED-D TaxID=3418768 RepID=UPI003D04A05A
MLIELGLLAVWAWWRWPVSGVIAWRSTGLVVGAVGLAVAGVALACCWAGDQLRRLADWAAENAEVLE